MQDRTGVENCRRVVHINGQIKEAVDRNSQKNKMDSFFWFREGDRLAEKYVRLANFKEKILGVGAADF